MKTSDTAFVIAIASALTLPACACAQSTAPVTRAQVKAELRTLEQAGYNPATSDDINYPSDIQAAEARVRARGLAPTSAVNAQNGQSLSGSGAE